MKLVHSARVAVFLAVRSISRGNAGVTLMSVAMVAVVFVSVSFLPSLLGGAVYSIDRQLRGTLTGDLTITSADATAIDSAASYLAQIRVADGVAAATGTRRVGTQIAAGDESNAWGVDAIDPISFADVFTTAEALIEGEFLQPGDLDGIVLGIDIAGADQNERRGHASSLRTVHVGDQVEVTMAGGGSETFTVRGIYANEFALSDASGFITIAAADARIPTEDYAAQVEEMYTALDRVAEGLNSSADAAGEVAGGAEGLAGAIDTLADGVAALADGADDVDAGASALASAATEVADGAEGLASIAGSLSGSLQVLSDDVATAAVSAAQATAAGAQAVAESAAGLAVDCPVDAPPEYCAQLVVQAEATAGLATQAAGTATLVESTASGVAAAAEVADGLADRAGRLSEAAASLADGARSLAGSTDELAAVAGQLAKAAASASGSAWSLAGGAETLAGSLETSAEELSDTDSAERDALVDALSGIRDVPGEDTVMRITIVAEPGVGAEELAAAIEPLRDDVDLQTPDQLAVAIEDQLDTFGLVDSIMRVISLLVAAITVFIITYVDLVNRRRQIGIERAIGIRSAAIVASYVLKTLATAVIGIAFGYLLLRFALVPLVDRFPFQFPNGPVTLMLDPGDALRSAGVLLIVAAVSALVPAVRTVRMRILDAIWGT